MSFEIRPCTTKDRSTVAASAARALTIDPLFGWIGGNRLSTHRMMASLLVGILSDAIAHGECWVADTRRDGPVGMAAWFAPGTSPQGGRRGLAIAARSFRGLTGIRHPVTGARLTAQLEQAHPKTDHWYLMLMAVDPEWQGRGLGGALMEPGLHRADADGLPSYLETQKHENVAWYARHGFDLTSVVEVAGAPPMWCMQRPPRDP